MKICKRVEVDPVAEVLSITEEVTATISCSKTDSTYHVAATGSVDEVVLATMLLLDRFMGDEDFGQPLREALAARKKEARNG